MTGVRKIAVLLKSIIFFLPSSLCLISATAQTEYLVKVDPSTGVYTKIDSIPGVMLYLW